MPSHSKWSNSDEPLSDAQEQVFMYMLLQMRNGVAIWDRFTIEYTVYNPHMDASHLVYYVNWGQPVTGVEVYAALKLQCI